MVKEFYESSFRSQRNVTVLKDFLDYIWILYINELQTIVKHESCWNSMAVYSELSAFYHLCGDSEILA